MKRIKKTLCLLLLVFSVMLVLPVTANASTNGHTQQEAMAWVRAQVGKNWITITFHLHLHSTSNISVWI